MMYAGEREGIQEKEERKIDREKSYPVHLIVLNGALGLLATHKH